uniref:Kringle domain-containing protein n=1 Tax=Capitella teleta TaxID=283909 RepID=X1YZB6_CAPTE
GKEYMGEKSFTVNGRVCQRWDMQTPHGHDGCVDVSEFPAGTLTLDRAENFCRNPDNEPLGPWCYTMDPLERFETCALPLCSGKMLH